MKGAVRLDDLRIDLDRQRVERDGMPLDVAGLSFRLLAHLLAQGDRVARFDELIAAVWAPAVVNEETVTQRVSLLRQALGDDGRQPRYLRSVRGQGYQLVALPEPWIDVPAAAPPSGRRGRRALIASIAALVVLAIAAAAWWHARGTPAQRSELVERAAWYARIGQADNNARAIALYRERLRQVRGDRDAQLGLSRALSAQVCLYNGAARTAEQALALAAAMVAARDDDAAAHAALGYANDCLGRADVALAQYERAFALDPDDDGSRASAAYLYQRKGRFAEALSANLAVRRPENVRFHALQLATLLDALGETGAADARLRRMFRLYPDNVFSNSAWPRFLLLHGRAVEARQALTAAQSRATPHPDLDILAAELALARGDRAAASTALRHAQTLRPGASFPQTLAWSIDGIAIAARAPALAQARALLDGVRSGADPADAVEAALLFDTCGDRPAAMAALRAAVAAGYRDKVMLQSAPWWQTLAADPQFPAVIAGIDRALAVERRRVEADGSLRRALSAAR